MSLEKQFNEKFNVLDQLCRKKYPEYDSREKPFEPLRQFKSTLDKTGSKHLENLIDARNILSHSPVPLISIEKGAINLLDGFINGLRRQAQYGSDAPIDPELEKLRADNLKIMSNALNDINGANIHVNETIRERYKAAILDLVQKEKDATSVAEIRKNFFDFKEIMNKLLESEKKARKTHALKRSKEEAINDVSEAYYDTIRDIKGIFGIGKRRQAKLIKEDAISRINSTETLDNIEEIAETAIDLLNDIN